MNCKNILTCAHLDMCTKACRYHVLMLLKDFSAGSLYQDIPELPDEMTCRLREVICSGSWEKSNPYSILRAKQHKEKLLLPCNPPGTHCCNIVP